MISRRLIQERGTVLVLVAAAMFPMIGMLTFAIDVSHWFDYSRNLQNRADAAALAGADAYGDICFNPPGSPWSGAQSVIGKWAQLYSGPGAGEPADNGGNAAANVPYDDGAVFAATGAGSYVNQPNLQAGLLSKYYVRLNANNYFDQGGTNFAMGDFCSSDPSKDATDHNPGQPGAMVDVKVTQNQLPNFIPIFGAIGPNIEGHARVEIQQQQGAKGLRPIAVSDASFVPCITAYFLNSDGAVIQSEALTQTSPGIWTSNALFKGVDQAKAVAMPATAPVTVQLFLNNCDTTSPTGTKYDYFNDKGKEQQIGLVYINNWGAPTPPTTHPQIAAGGVHLTGSQATPCDPYFQSSSNDCTIGADAFVAWTGGGGVHYVRAIDCGKAGGCGATSTPAIDLTGGAGNEWSGSGLTITHDTGPHYIDIAWSQLGGTVNGVTCTPTVDNKGNPNDPWKGNNPCRGDLGPQQRAFAGTNGTNACNNPNFDTGPMEWITVGTTNAPAATYGANSYGGGSSPNLYITTQIQGLANSGPTDPPICLRVAEQTSHATGFVDCGQGKGASADQTAIEQGCPKPVQKDIRHVPPPDGPLICSPAITPMDCVDNDPGQSSPILKGFDNLIGTGPGAPTSCETNFWPNGNKAPVADHDFTLKDKRAVILIITAPTDMAVTNGTATIPIRDFAVFYVTGWSTGNGGVKGCSGGNPVVGPSGRAYNGANDSPPTGAGSGEIWGHWTSIAVPPGLGTGNGVQCDFTMFGNCVGVLTR